MYSLDTINSLVLRKQHLTDDSAGGGVSQVARDVGGLHATSGTTPYLSLFIRMKSFRRETLDAELQEKRLAKIRCVRGTMYILPTDIYPAAFSALRHTLKLKPNRYKQYLGITPEEFEELSRSITEIVSSKGTTVTEAKRSLASSANISRAMGLMCDYGWLARGMPKAGWAANNYTYYPFSDYFPGLTLDSVPEHEAIVSLIRHYLAAFGPATEDDIAWWTGLTKKKVKEALRELQGQIVNADIPELKGNFLMLRSDEEKLQKTKALRKPAISLLPVLDPYIMGYKGRDRFLDPAYYSSVYDRSGNGTSTILLNGRIVGIWDFARGPEPSILLCPFEDFPEDALSEIYAKARSMGLFIAGRDCKVKEIDRVENKAWNFMSPLKGDAPGTHAGT